MSILDNYNPRIIKERWNKVKGSPYASLKFQYGVTKGVIIMLILFISYTLIKIILTYDGGSGIMTMTVRSVILVVMVVFALKAWSTLAPLKKTLKQYEQNPVAQKSTGEKIDVVAEVNQILDNIERNKNKKVI